MKSYQIQFRSYPHQVSNYSDLQVLQSNAGFYIGTIYTDPKYSYKEPGSRDTNYFPTEVLAKAALTLLISLHEQMHEQHHPQDIMAEWAIRASRETGIDCYYRENP